MDKATTSAVLGTILGVAAGIVGMLWFAEPQGESDIAQLEERMLELTRERDTANDDADTLRADLDALKRKVSNLETANKDLADELARRDKKSDGGEEASEWKAKHDSVKTAADETARQDEARIKQLEALLEKNGILEHLSDEEIQRRMVEHEAAFNTAISGKDKTAAMQALWDISALGPKAYDKAVELWKVIAEDYGLNPFGQGPGELGITFQDYVSLIGNFGLVEHGLTDPDVDPSFRIAAIYGSPWWANEDADKRAQLVGDVLLKSEGYESQAAVDALKDIDDPTTTRYLSDYLVSNTDNPAARRQAVLALAQKNTDAGWAAIQDAAENDPDPEVKQAAQSALNQKDAPVAGVLITWIGEENQAALAGIKLGDILTHYNGVRIKTIAAINEAKAGVEEGQSVQVIVRRGESDVTLTLAPGMIGINGVAVAPKE